MNICLYGASSNELDYKYIEQVKLLGTLMAKRKHRLVFGGGAQGLMGAAVEGISQSGGHSTGIAPTFFDKPGILFKECSEFIFTETMSERKQLMEDRSDAFIMVPGGIGTLEEFFEILTLKQLGKHNKPIAVYNVNNYYDDLSRMLDRMVEENFMKAECQHIYAVFDNPDRLLDYIEKEANCPLDVSHLKNI